MKPSQRKVFQMGIFLTMGGVLPLTFGAGVAGYTLKYLHDETIQNCKALLPHIIAKQEQAFGIKHEHKLELLATPKIFFQGEYDPSTNNITMSSLNYAISPIAATEATLHHELGHSFADQCSEQLGKGNFPEEKRTTKEEDVSDCLIGQGIAEYFERRFTKQKDDFEDTEWPTTTNEFLTDRITYGGGYHLVKPILDKAGVQRGVEYLVQHPLTSEDFRDIPAYQKRTLEALEK